MLDIIRMCRHLGVITHIPMNMYEPDGSRVEMGFSGYNHEDILQTDPGFRSELLDLRDPSSPAFYHEGKHVIYAVIPSDAGRTIILGPVCSSKETEADSRASALLHGIKDSQHFAIPPASLRVIYETALMLFNASSETELTAQDLLMNADKASDLSLLASADAYRIVFDHRENSTSHNSYAQERREQKAVREGNIEALRKSWEEVQTGQIGRLAKDIVTHYRNLAVVNITLASRSAIEGGVLPEVAYSLADSYTMQLEDMTDVSDIVRLFRSAEMHYAELVRDITHSKSRNIYIRRCKELIHDRLHEHVYAEDLAEELGITRSYLSQLFLKEEGMHLSEFILREKVKASEHLLMYPDIPLGRIAATFGFSSQSHYGQVFRKYMGMTPGEYREVHTAGK